MTADQPAIGEVKVHPTRQLDLLARKLLAAHLLRLLHDAHLGPEASETEPGPANYRSFVRNLIEEVHKADLAKREAGEVLTLHEFLTNYSARVAKTRSMYQGEPFETAQEKLAGGLPEFRCSDCGDPDSNFACKGGGADRLMFEHESGALCLKFLTDMIRDFTALTEAHYGELAGHRVPAPLVPEIVLETYRKRDAAGTLAIDGLFQPPHSDGAATLKVLWPLDRKLDDAILSLPYLVFHEVFVHGAQGAGRNGRRFAVDQDCAFTEGGVDAVACDVLLNQVLLDSENLPTLLQPLIGDFAEKCEDYHSKRFKAPEMGADKPGDHIRRARALGRRYVAKLIRSVGVISKRDPDWADRVVLLLNLYLDPQQRKELFFILSRCEHLRRRKLMLADPLKKFEQDHDADALMTTLRTLVPIKNAGA